MAMVLYIKANPKNDQDSRTFQISEHFIQTYRTLHSEDNVVTLDLYRENVKPLTGEEVGLTHAPKTPDHPFLKYALQFNQAEKIVLAAPLWNLGVPSILKAYLDYVMIAGINFRYTEAGPEGLCAGKKAVHITSRGSVYTEEPYAQYEMADRYLRTILGFLGIINVRTIAAEGLDIQGADVKTIVDQAKKERKK
ncbi:MAG: FMN-dependent NADH-azoreductase [Bacteroidota bacterium]